jgi:hypothetical protein
MSLNVTMNSSSIQLRCFVIAVPRFLKLYVDHLLPRHLALCLIVHAFEIRYFELFGVCGFIMLVLVNWFRKG